jgi:hypothetical protein
VVAPPTKNPNESKAAILAALQKSKTFTDSWCGNETCSLFFAVMFLACVFVLVALRLLARLAFLVNLVFMVVVPAMMFLVVPSMMPLVVLILLVVFLFQHEVRWLLTSLRHDGRCGRSSGETGRGERTPQQVQQHCDDNR